MAADRNVGAREHRRTTREIEGLLRDVAPPGSGALVPFITRSIFQRLCFAVGAPLVADLQPEAGVLPTEVLGRLGRILDAHDWSAADESFRWSATLSGIYERSLARKALGAYYTAPDVAAYISRSTLIPRLFDLLGEAPDLERLAGSEGVRKYLPEAVRAADPLPLEAPYEHSQRLEWKRRLEADWRSGAITTLDHCVTANLDLRRIARDCIHEHPDPKLIRRFATCLAHLKVLDPTCGAGDFLLAAFDVLLPLHAACAQRLGDLPPPAGVVLRCLHGGDVLPEALEVCRMRLLLRALAAGAGCDLARRSEDVAVRLAPGDVLARDDAGFDTVVGNPPYVTLPRDGGPYAGRGYETAGCGNLYALVMERAQDTLAPGGRLGMIVPISSVSVPAFQPLARRLLRDTCWVSTFSNRPGKLFEGVEQRLAIWLTAPGDPPRLYASPYQHWWSEERSLLFDRLRYHPVPSWAQSGMPVKIGCPISERIFQGVNAHGGTLADLTGRGEGAVWLHDGPTYWVRALPFAPHEPDAPPPSHYYRISVADEDTAYVLSAILSSSTFYLYYKVTSNCRDLGRADWQRFPIDPLPPDRYRELAHAGARLAAVLRVTATRHTRVYPGGEIAYREYHPACARPILDEIDEILAGHFGFTAEELEYILSCDVKYRIGRGERGAERDRS